MEEALQLNRSDFAKTLLMPDEHAWWNALQNRDAAYDGIFVFGVRSTGIYCRPSCPARRARRDQVRFFNLPESAEQAGFRACRRCKPTHISPHDSQVNLIRKACQIIATHIEDPIPISKLAGQFHISSYHFHRIFKKILGITPKQYAQACRSNSVKQRLRQGESIVEAVYASGYGSSSRLYESSNKQFGMTPSEYKHGGEGIRIHYATVRCFLGRLFVAATEKGICSVRIGSSDEELERSFKKEFRFADIQKDSEPLAGYVNKILKHLEGQSPNLKLPLDIQGTAFQWRVWQELQKIPYGATRSYRQIAAKMGHPTAVRAVARACATNPVAIVVPCHRVVRHDGSLGGYRWGSERKKALLNREKQGEKNKRVTVQR